MRPSIETAPESGGFPSGPEMERWLTLAGAVAPSKLEEKLQVIRAHRIDPPLQIHCKWKKGQYFRILMIDPARSLFREEYLDWKLWDSYAASRDRLFREASAELASGRTDAWRERCGDIARLTQGLFVEKDLPVPEAGKWAFVDMLFDGVEAPPELEMLHPAVTRRILSNREPPLPAGKGRGILVYDSALAGAEMEAAGIMEAPGAEMDWECFAASLLAGQSGRLRGAEALHFTGHGELSEGKGALTVGGKSMTDAPALASPGRIFLNSCLAGLSPLGIVESFLREGASEVIASPWSLPDDGSSGAYGVLWERLRPRFRDFPGAAVLALGAALPDFPLRYRRYGVYRG